MSELAVRYGRVHRNYLDLPGVRDEGRYVLAWLHQSPSRDVVPGLLRLGPHGLAEEIGWTRRKLGGALDQLRGHVIVNESARVMFILGAIRDDFPRNENQMIAFAKQINQMPFCDAVAAACAEIEAGLERSAKSLQDKWRALNCYTNRSVNGSPNSRHQTQTQTQTQIQITDQGTRAEVPPASLRAARASAETDDGGYAGDARRCEDEHAQLLVDRLGGSRRRRGAEDFVPIGKLG